MTSRSLRRRGFRDALMRGKKASGQRPGPGNPHILRALLADAGYFSDENVKRCEAEGIEPYIASGRERHHRPLAERLAPVPECPAQADGVAAMGHRMKTPEGRALYAKRKSTVETVFGVIKEVMGFRRFHLRGLEAVQGEWALVCMAWNLKRMHVAVA